MVMVSVLRPLERIWPSSPSRASVTLALTNSFETGLVEAGRIIDASVASGVAGIMSKGYRVLSSGQ
jgi:hypothetical protein